ncbi:hypothetical protein [Falsarthrobacter nasiphocae]|uniref:Uncharacterized protein n=1 Tax=Falsarthrobacter nasiphocae TaxID=189863 RepID=A0AAE3YGS3_9MICC|nr:hypothetical protein [Falsarthrobacter nasiphocae]MDR6891716.1 hypothetical protein [Falsarthrobacter nasiphocae]
MTNQISRRAVSRNAAWAVPAIALASAAPSASASPALPAGCHLTDAQLNAGVCGTDSIQVLGARSFSTTGGGLINATTANNFGLKSTCNYKGSVSVYFYDPSTGLGSKVAPATIRLADGTTFTGRATLGAIGSGIAQTGFDMSVSIQWQGSKGSNSPASRWTGALVTIPFDWYYTAPDGSLHSCRYALQYTMGTPYSVGVAAMVNPVVIPA